MKAIIIDSMVEVLCYWNGTILRTKTDLRYIGNNVEIKPIDVPIHMTFVELLNMYMISLVLTNTIS